VSKCLHVTEEYASSKKRNKSSDNNPNPSYTLLLLLLASLLSPLCRIFTIIYLKQTVFVGHIVLQLLYIDSLWYGTCHIISLVKCFILIIIIIVVILVVIAFRERQYKSVSHSTKFPLPHFHTSYIKI